MPLGEFTDQEGKVTANFGTNLNGTHSTEYCQFCFQQGAFTQPSFTLQKMIELSVSNMTGELKMPQEKAQELANAVIPKLKRWAK